MSNTWRVTVVDGNGTTTITSDMEASHAQTGDNLVVTNAPGVSYSGSLFAYELSGFDQTNLLVGHSSMQVGNPYTIMLSMPPDAPGVDYYIRNEPFFVDVVDGANGTLRVGGG